MDYLTTVLAMHGVRIVAGEAAIFTFVTNFAGTENGLYQPQEQGDAKNHDHHRQNVTAGADQDDVTEPGGSQCRDGEIQRLDVVCDTRVCIDLQDIHNGGDNKDKDDQVDDAENNVLAQAYEAGMREQAAESVIGP